MEVKELLAPADLYIELVDIADLTEWDRNPRDRDPERFEWLQLSLRKFGFVTPIFARKSDGLIFSGHQRLAAATAIGLTQVPVHWVEKSDSLADDKCNIVFNLITNDHDTKADFGIKSALEIKSVVGLMAALPDTTNKYPCLDWEMICPLEYQAELVSSKLSESTRKYAAAFVEENIDIPVTIDRHTKKILNGRNRLAAALDAGRLSFPAVFIEEHGDLLSQFLNKITMSFDLEKVFGASLRYNERLPIRNRSGQRKYIGVAFYGFEFQAEYNKGQKAWAEQNLVCLEGEYRSRWIARHGTTCIDFGAGGLDNTFKVKAMGVKCIPFEPFLTTPGTDKVNRLLATIMTKKFLTWLKSGEKLDSLFVSYIFNSVPYQSDRAHLMTLFQALCCKGATMFFVTMSAEANSTQYFNKVQSIDHNGSKIMLDAEPGTFAVGLLGQEPKIQKHYGKLELVNLARSYFGSVRYARVGKGGESHGIECRGSRPIDPGTLIKAIEFEFNLEYPDGKPMGLVDNAIEAFSVYTGIDLMQCRSGLSVIYAEKSPH